MSRAPWGFEDCNLGAKAANVTAAPTRPTNESSSRLVRLAALRRQCRAVFCFVRYNSACDRAANAREIYRFLLVPISTHKEVTIFDFGDVISMDATSLDRESSQENLIIYPGPILGSTSLLNMRIRAETERR